MQSNLALQDYSVLSPACDDFKREKFNELLNSLPEKCGPAILNSFVKAWNLVNGAYDWPNITVCVSGGSDSDVVVDLMTKIDIEKKCKFVYADNGMEFGEIVREHLNFLEQKYGISIARYRTQKPVICVVREKGIPFLNKRVSEMIYRLQMHNFQWEDEPYEVLVKRYSGCESALQWWCGDSYYGKGSRLSIEWNRGLKAFLIGRGPGFKVSARCCIESKERTLKNAIKEMGDGLIVTGVRKAESGYRAVGMKSCTSLHGNGGDFRPIFWYKEADKRIYCEHFGVEHSFCYTAPEHALRRTGCAMCPCSLPENLENEMEFAKKYDFNRFKAAMNVFGPSYELAAEYRKFAKSLRQ